MSVLSDFGDATVDDNTCPHGVEGVDEEPLRCYYCYRSDGSETLALTDPTRSDSE